MKFYIMKISIRGVSPMIWRRLLVTYLLDSGASLKVAQENAGHSDIGTTMLYRHVAQIDRHTETRHLSLEVIKKNKLKNKKKRADHRY